jgi:hypothetical protein
MGTRLIKIRQFDREVFTGRTPSGERFVCVYAGGSDYVAVRLSEEEMDSLWQGRLSLCDALGMRLRRGTHLVRHILGMLELFDDLPTISDRQYAVKTAVKVDEARGFGTILAIE